MAQHFIALSATPAARDVILGIGLTATAAIAEAYQGLGFPAPEVTEEGGEFVVRYDGETHRFDDRDDADEFAEARTVIAQRCTERLYEKVRTTGGVGLGWEPVGVEGIMDDSTALDLDREEELERIEAEHAPRKSADEEAEAAAHVASEAMQAAGSLQEVADIANSLSPAVIRKIIDLCLYHHIEGDVEPTPSEEGHGIYWTETHWVHQHGDNPWTVSER